MKFLILANLLLTQFQLKSIGENKIVLEFIGPDYYFTKGYTEKGEELTFLVGTVLLDRDSTAPFIPYYELKIALNDWTGYSVKVTPEKVITRENVNLPTVPQFSSDGLSTRYALFKGEEVKYPMLSYSGKAELINGIPSAKILFTPYFYDPKDKSLTYIQKAIIEIKIEGEKKLERLSSGWYDIIYSENFPGYQGIILQEEIKKQINPFSQASLWFQIKILEEGFYSISYKDLEKEGLPYPVENLRVALFSRRSDTLPSSPFDTLTQLIKIPVEIIDKNHNNVFDGDDEIRFYTKSTKGIRNNLTGFENAESLIISRFSYFDNPYTDTLVLWLGIGSEPERIIERNLTFTNIVPTLTTYYHHEKNLQNVAWKGLLWVGEEILRNSGRQSAEITFNINLESIGTPEGYIKLRYSGGENLARSLKAVFNGVDSTIDASFYGYALRTKQFYFRSAGTNNTLKIEIYGGNTSVTDRVYLDYFTIFYRKYTQSLSDEVAFYTSPDTTLAKIPISNNLIAVFDITNPLNPVKLKKVEINSASFISDSLYPGKVYYFASTLKKPAKIELAIRAGNLYELNTNPDYIAITPSNFISSLYKYKNYRERKILRPHQGEWAIQRGRVEIVSVEDIMRDFAFGTYDPVALRNFLKYIFNRTSGNLIYVGLWGDACYDYKNINGTSGNLVPAYEPFLSTYIDEEKGAKDDFYVDFNGDGYPDILIGRIPFRNKEQLSTYLDKLIKYEESSIFSAWRTRVLFVADDEYGESGQPTEIAWHIPLSNIIRRDTIMTPNFCEVRLVYETSYGVRNNILDLKLRGFEAKQDFIRKFNEGNFILTFFGHGNPVQLTHEQLLLLQDLPQLNASYKNPLCSFLSCKVGAFTRENPPLGIAEYMAIYNQAIATIGSTIGQFVTINSLFGQNIHRIISDRKFHPAGEIVARAKLTSLALTYYHLFGDPATIIYLPLPDSVTSIEIPDTFWIGKVNTSYILNVEPGSEYYTLFYHKPYVIKYVNPQNASVSVSYLGENKILFRGPYKPRNLPDSISFFMSGTADTGSGFTFVFLQKTKESGITRGIYKSNIFSALSSITTSDKEGPDIRVLIDGREVDSTVTTGPNFTITVELEDSSGINLYNIFGNEKGIMLVDGNNFIDLTPYFEYYPNSYTKGSLKYSYSSNSTGIKELRIVAYDNLNNFSQKTIRVSIQSTSKIIDEFVIAPNPTRHPPVYITFRLYTPARVKIQIFTVNGRLVYQTQETFMAPGFKIIDWNFKDIFGDIVSNGLYIVKLIAIDEYGKKEEYIKGFVIGK
jgi:YHS domain-containing protein